MRIQLAVHQKHIISFVPGTFDIWILRLDIRRIQQDKLLVLVSLLRLNSFPVLVYAEILAICILEQTELHRPLTELLVTEHTVFDEQLEVVPFLLQGFSFVLENLLQTVCHLPCDVS